MALVVDDRPGEGMASSVSREERVMKVEYDAVPTDNLRLDASRPIHNESRLIDKLTDFRFCSNDAADDAAEQQYGNQIPLWPAVPRLEPRNEKEGIPHTDLAAS